MLGTGSPLKRRSHSSLYPIFDLFCGASCHGSACCCRRVFHCHRACHCSMWPPWHLSKSCLLCVPLPLRMPPRYAAPTSLQLHMPLPPCTLPLLCMLALLPPCTPPANATMGTAAAARAAAAVAVHVAAVASGRSCGQPSHCSLVFLECIEFRPWRPQFLRL